MLEEQNPKYLLPFGISRCIKRANQKVVKNKIYKRKVERIKKETQK
jgi:hypothetical protein